MARRRFATLSCLVFSFLLLTNAPSFAQEVSGAVNVTLTSDPVAAAAAYQAELSRVDSLPETALREEVTEAAVELEATVDDAVKSGALAPNDPVAVTGKKLAADGQTKAKGKGLKARIIRGLEILLQGVGYAYVGASYAAQAYTGAVVFPIAVGAGFGVGLAVGRAEVETDGGQVAAILGGVGGGAVGGVGVISILLRTGPFFSTGLPVAAVLSVLNIVGCSDGSDDSGLCAGTQAVREAMIDRPAGASRRAGGRLRHWVAVKIFRRKEKSAPTP